MFQYYNKLKREITNYNKLKGKYFSKYNILHKIFTNIY